MLRTASKGACWFPIPGMEYILSMANVTPQGIHRMIILIEGKGTDMVEKV